MDYIHGDIKSIIENELPNTLFKCNVCGNKANFQIKGIYQNSFFEDIDDYPEYKKIYDNPSQIWTLELYALMQCPNCKEYHCFRFYTNEAQYVDYSDFIDQCLDTPYIEKISTSFINYIDNYKLIDFNTKQLETIENKQLILYKISPKYKLLKSDLIKAQEYELNDLLGIGYRKALELMLTDFLIDKRKLEIFDSVEDYEKYLNDEKIEFKNKDTLDKIIDLRLNNLISQKEIRDLLNTNILEAIRELGNDETHYKKNYSRYNFAHMINMVKYIENSIENMLISEDIADDIKKEREAKKAKQNNI